MNVKEAWNLAQEYMHGVGYSKRTIWDVDGTLAKDTHRAHLRPQPTAVHHIDGHVTGREPIERYMAPTLVALDDPIVEARRLVDLIGARSQAIVATGRWRSLFEVTHTWIMRHFPALRPMQVLCRPTEDHTTPGHLVKIRLIRFHTRGIWIDDDPEMIRLAESHGYIALKAPEVYEVI